ncbi:MAG: DUF4197 domain-containing protein [Flavobacteriales bacterium]|jgi:hypothetical protein|nr:DUF4197 domain-containing protein [Flavobacteriales bacterium]
MKKIFALPLIVLLTASCAELQDMANQVGTTTGTPLSNADVVAGLKQALEKGAEHSVDVASVADGFWKNPRLRIPFPPEAEKMKNTLNDIGMSSQVDKFELTMNRAAEAAAKEAVPVFVNAIKGMTVADGFAILRGGDNAATNFLKEKTTPELIAKFQPIVVKATQEVALTSYWTPLAGAYNKTTLFTGGQAINPDLDAYVTQKAIDGLFLLVADEELKIRQDPLARTTDLLQRVFGGK